jgi:hypothetical protein
MMYEDDSKAHEAAESPWLKKSESMMGNMPMPSSSSSRGEIGAFPKMPMPFGGSVSSVPKMPMK